MSARPRVAAITLALLLAGCLTAADEPVTPSYVEDEDARAEDAEGQTGAQNATLPDGRGESAGLAETNKTEEGVGGMEHKHDYWKGRETVVLLRETVDLGCPPCMPDGEGTQAKSVAYVKLGTLPEGDESALVYEGAERVEVVLGAPQFLFRHAPLPHAAPPKLFLQWRSAADATWNDPVEVAYDVPVVIDVAPEMADMPHSTHSLWVWRITTDRPEVGIGVPMTVTVHRGRDVVDWPGHPDFYADAAERVVMDKLVTTHMGGYDNILLYGSEGTWANPPKLISWGTREIHVFVNVTEARTQFGLAPTGYFLEAHNATVIGPELTFGSRHRDVDGNDDLKSYHFALLVDEGGMDGPYQPGSRWGFRMMAMFGDVDGVIGACPGCMPYDIQYEIKVVALSYETGTAQTMEPV